MKLYVDIAAICFFAVSAALWFVASRVEVPKIGRGIDDLDRVTELSAALQKQASWNVAGSITLGVAIALQALSTFLLSI